MTETAPPDVGRAHVMVRAAWEKVLGHTDFADDEPFLTISGGNSLTAVQVMVALTEQVGSRLPMRMILRHRTVDELAVAVAGQLAGDGTPS